MQIRGWNRVLVGTGGTLAVCAVLALGALQAAAGPGGGADTPVCHYDGQGRVRLIYVNHNAVDAHFAHGDHGLLWFFADADGDGYGDGAAGVEACAAPEGHVDNNGDCNDADAGVSPAADEVCGDGVDNDCDGDVDEGCVGCADILLHCGAGSPVLQTICGPGPHELTGTVRFNASYLDLGPNVAGAILTQCGTGAQMSVTGDTNFCGLPGGCCGAGRWNDEVCEIELF